MKKERIIHLGGILVFYMILVFGVIALNARIEYIDEANRVVSLNN